MATPLRLNGIPLWLATQDEDDVTNKHYKRSIRYYKKLYAARCEGWANQDKVAAIYRECKRRRKAGEDVQVDHLIPISHPHVCGLHNEFNLEITSTQYNLSKGNRWWPDMWNSQDELQLQVLEAGVPSQENTKEEDRGLSTPQQTSLPLLQAGYIKTYLRKREGAYTQEEMHL